MCDGVKAEPQHWAYGYHHHASGAGHKFGGEVICWWKDSSPARDHPLLTL